MIRPTPKMVEEAINWTGPFLDNQQPGQLRTYVGVLREFALKATLHPDFMREFVGFGEEPDNE